MVEIVIPVGTKFRFSYRSGSDGRERIAGEVLWGEGVAARRVPNTPTFLSVLNSDMQFPNGWDKLIKVTRDYRLYLDKNAEVLMVGRPDRSEWKDGVRGA